VIDIKLRILNFVIIFKKWKKLLKKNKKNRKKMKKYLRPSTWSQ